MAVSLVNTGVQFPDSTIQTVATAGYFTGTNQSLSANGYQKLPNGAIIQWGYNAPSTVTFPVAFPNACRSVVATQDNGAGGSGLTVRCVSLTNSNFVLGSDVCCSNIARNRYWIAVGY